MEQRGNDPLARQFAQIEEALEIARGYTALSGSDHVDVLAALAAVVEVREQLRQSTGAPLCDKCGERHFGSTHPFRALTRADQGAGQESGVKAESDGLSGTPNGWTRLAALIRLENAMGVVLAGLKVGDNISTAWHEWPEYRDLEEVEETLRALDALRANSGGSSNG